MGTSMGVSAKLLLVSFVHRPKNLAISELLWLVAYTMSMVCCFFISCQVGNGYVNVLNSSERMFRFCARSGYIRSASINATLKMCSQILGALCI